MKYLKFFFLSVFLFVAPVCAQETGTSPTPPTNEQHPPYFSEEDKIEAIQEPQFGEIFMRMLLLLAVTLILFVLIAFFAKRFLQSRMKNLNRQGRIQIIDQRALSQKSMLYIVKVDEEEFLLADSHNGVVCVKSFKGQI